MIATLTVIALAIALGWPIATRLDPERQWTARAGEAFLFGAGVLWAITLLLDVTGLGWARVTLAIAVVVALAVVRFPLSAVRAALHDDRRAAEHGKRTTENGKRTTDNGQRPAENGQRFFAIQHSTFNIQHSRFSLLDLLTLIPIAGYTLLATAAAPWEFDYLTDFGLKARQFFEQGGIDWTYLRGHEHVVSFHPDYPLLLPLLFADVSIVAGEWTDHWLGLFNVAFGVALILVLRAEVARERHQAALATFILAPLALSPWIGLADGPLTAYITAAVLAIRRGAVTTGAVLLGLAASTKNEGLSMIVAAALAMLVAGRARELVRLWPAVAIPLPWLVLRGVHGLANDLASGSVGERLTNMLAKPRLFLSTLAKYPAGKRWLWLGIAVAFVLRGRAILTRDRFAVTAALLQFVFYLGAYLTTPHDLEWHIQWSWDRLVSHLAPLFAFVATSALLEVE
ncbi:MAG TPA: hypothetical protein VGF69_19370 [Thermoanaerobaculia bacterium]|jgi:hypothetical protein